MLSLTPQQMLPKPERTGIWRDNCSKSGPEHFRFSAQRTRPQVAVIAKARPFRADSVEKLYFDGERKFFRTADARFARGDVRAPHPFAQKRPRAFVSALESFAAAETPENRLSRNFESRSIFDFCNSICH